MMLNIPSTVEDPNYRYQMPALVTKVEGRGNGIKTNLVNLSDVAKAIKRPPAVCTKFFGVELGALSKYEGKDDKSIVNGRVQPEKLQDVLDKFIEKYVLCPVCRIPEIDVFIKKGSVAGRCAACAWNGNLDNTHRIATLLVKEYQSKEDTKTKKDKKRDEEEEEKKKRTVEEKEKKKEKKEKKKKKEKEKDESSGGQEKIETFRQLFEESNHTEIREVIFDLPDPASQKGYFLLHGIFDANLDVHSFKEHSEFLIKCLMPDNFGINFLGSLVHYYATFDENLVRAKKELPLVLKQALDDSFVEEIDLLDFFRDDKKVKGESKKFTNQFRETAKPLIVWLENASEETSNEEESEVPQSNSE